MPEWTHNGATFLRIAATLWVCGMIVRDVLLPEHDPVRADGSRRPGRRRARRRADSGRRRRAALDLVDDELIALVS